MSVKPKVDFFCKKKKKKLPGSLRRGPSKQNKEEKWQLYHRDIKKS